MEFLIALGISVAINAVFFALAALLIRGGYFSLVHVLTAALICAWGIRLGTYLFARILETGSRPPVRRHAGPPSPLCPVLGAAGVHRVGCEGFISSGLRRFSRHPNYFGESLLWWGLFVAVVPVFTGWDFLTALGPLFLTLLLLFVSGVPLLEKSADKKHGGKPAYQEYKRRTSLFIPLPARR
jgi:steroid 5-alpha reductase family enzyme